jgi:hypothetical protein
LSGRIGAGQNDQIKIAMPFQQVSLHSIRSNNQRTLATQWNTLAAANGFPAIDVFQPQAAGHNPEQIIVWDVDHAGEAGLRRFRVRTVGLRAMEAFGGSMVGKTMEELVPPALRAISLNGARECAQSGCAVYEIISTVDANAHQVDCERLLLPFGCGNSVDQIVASLQLISFQGTVEREAIRRDFEAGPQVTFSGMILSDAMARLGPEALTLRKEQTATPAMAAPLMQQQDAPAKLQGPDKRKAARRTVVKTGRIRFGKTSENCTVRDMSTTGASIEVADAMNVPEIFSLVLEMESAARKCVVMWRRERQLGVKFG